MIDSCYADIQVNGFGGVDFSQETLTVDQVREVTCKLVECGTIRYCPTICTSSMEIYRRNLGVLAEVMNAPDTGNNILGIHLEGPFISSLPGAVGAHRVDCVRMPSVEDFNRFQEWSDGRVSVLTLAPELPGADKLIEHAASQGVAVMYGHHLADTAAMQRGLDAGAKGCTHVGNGLPNEIHRHNNPLWWQLANDDMWCSFITDGHHLPPEFIKVAVRAKGIDRFIVTSDASPLAGLPAGIYDWFGKKVLVEASGRISIAGTDYLAASSATMYDCVSYLSSLGIFTQDELRQVSFINPLSLLGKPIESNG